MIGLIYKSRHGSTKKIAKVIKMHIKDSVTLLDYKDLKHDDLKVFDTIVLGVPVYYGKLDEEMVHFIKNNQEILAQKDYSIFVMALFYSEFMRYLTEAFDYEILKNTKTLAGLGGALYYPDLSISEKMVLSVMNKKRPLIPKGFHGEIYENFNDEEIERFALKIEKIDKQKAA